MTRRLGDTPAKSKHDLAHRRQQFWKPRAIGDEVWQGRDRALRLSWRCNEYEFAKCLDLPLAGSAKNVRAMISVAVDAVHTALHFPELRVSCSRRNGWWHETRRYRDPDFTYYNVVPAIDALLEAGILIDYDLQPAGRSTGVQSSYRPAPWLAEIILPELRYEVGEVIRMKDVEGRLVDYRDNDRTRRDRCMLAKINRRLTETEIDLNVTAAIRDGNAIRLDGYSVLPGMTSLYRVYKGGWDRGGRFYGGWWQSCRKAHRQHLTIDGHSTVELDYQQIHPRLLYGIAGRHLEGDAYTISGWDRGVVKKAFNTLLNTKDFNEARGAIAKNLGADRDAAEWLMLDITMRHPDIKSYFHSGIGMVLQNIDSEICRQVLVEMYRKSCRFCRDAVARHLRGRHRTCALAPGNVRQSSLQSTPVVACGGTPYRDGAAHGGACQILGFGPLTGPGTLCRVVQSHPPRRRPAPRCYDRVTEADTRGLA